MTIRHTASKSNYLPVVFRLYKLHAWGEHKGQPDPSTFTTLKLERCIDPQFAGEKYESVGDTIKRLKEMLAESDSRWQMLACEESASERDARRRKDGVEVITSTAPVITTSAASVEPMSVRLSAKPINDDDLGIREDNGKIKVKSKKASKKPVEAVAA
jgi:hypothetical protein